MFEQEAISCNSTSSYLNDVDYPPPMLSKYSLGGQSSNVLDKMRPRVRGKSSLRSEKSSLSS